MVGGSFPLVHSKNRLANRDTSNFPEMALAVRNLESVIDDFQEAIVALNEKHQERRNIRAVAAKAPPAALLPLPLLPPPPPPAVLIPPPPAEVPLPGPAIPMLAAPPPSAEATAMPISKSGLMPCLPMSRSPTCDGDVDLAQPGGAEFAPTTPMRFVVARPKPSSVCPSPATASTNGGSSSTAGEGTSSSVSRFRARSRSPNRVLFGSPGSKSSGSGEIEE